MDALRGVIDAAGVLGWQPRGLVASPITGPAGNHEYLLWLGMDRAGAMLDLEALVAETIS